MGAPTMGAGNQFEFHEQSQAAKQQVFDSARACIPAGWMAATLELKVTGLLGFGPLAIHHRLTNPENGDEADDFTSELFDSTSKLHSIFTDHGQRWTGCVISMELDGTGQIIRSKTTYEQLLRWVHERTYRELTAMHDGFEQAQRNRTEDK
jgi:hypothetical protein